MCLSCLGTIVNWVIVAPGAFCKTTFPRSAYCQTDNLAQPWQLCKFPNCNSCLVSPSSIVVHRDCLSWFVHHHMKDSVHRQLRWLWQAGDRQGPWQGAQPFNLEPFIRSRKFTELLLESFPMAGRLPNELTYIIKDLSTMSVLNRYCATMDLRAEMLIPEENPLFVPLSAISSWKRGGQPQFAAQQGMSFVRLTYDFRGLEQVERLDQWPKLHGRTENARAFHVVEYETLSTAWFDLRVSRSSPFTTRIIAYTGKCGSACLRFPQDRPSRFYLWDTPSPPPPENCFSHHAELDGIYHFRTVYLPDCTGLTFFMKSQSIYAIHKHTKGSEKSAQNPLNDPEKQQHSDMTREYTPIYIPIEGPIMEFSFSYVPGRTTKARELQRISVRTLHFTLISTAPNLML